MQQKRARQIFVLLLTGYKYLISPLLPSACRFHPTCSEYMREAIEMHGVGRGIWMGLKRLSRCHPFHEGGCDPVPRPASNVSSGAPRPLDYSASEGEPARRLAAR